MTRPQDPPHARKCYDQLEFRRLLEHPPDSILEVRDLIVQVLELLQQPLDRHAERNTTSAVPSIIHAVRLPRYKRIIKGAVAGIVAGTAYGFILQGMIVPISGDGHIPIMVILAKLLRSESLIVGWFYHLLISATNGGIFGWSFGWLLAEATLDRDYQVVSLWGGFYGVVWWVLDALTLAPVVLGYRLSHCSPFRRWMNSSLGACWATSSIGWSSGRASHGCHDTVPANRSAVARRCAGRLISSP